MADIIQDPKMESFIESRVSNDFGLTVDEVAEQCKTWGRFDAWLNQDVAQIKEVLNIVKDNGVSPAFFAAYERTEGYNPQYGWLNHTYVDGDYFNDAGSVSQWIKLQSQNTTDNPAWIDYDNYKDFVPEDTKQQGNQHFSTLSSGTIGKVVIAGTAAGTWEVYYPEGLLAENNGVQDYGRPLNNMIQYIEAWGGSVSGGSSTSNRQLAVLPIDYVHVTQGEYGSTSHDEESGQELAIDFAFYNEAGEKVLEYPLDAPFDIEVIERFDEFAQIVWKNTAPVMGVNGIEYDELHINVVHDNYWSDWNIGDRIKKGERMGYSGNSGYSTADHFHFEVFSGHNHSFPADPSTQLHIYDVFDTSGVTRWGNDGGYDWKTSDYVDGDTSMPTDPEPEPEPEPVPDTSHPTPPITGGLALQSWYWRGFFRSSETIIVRENYPSTSSPQVNTRIRPGTSFYFDTLYYNERMWWVRFKFASNPDAGNFYVPLGYKQGSNGFNTDNKEGNLWGEVSRLQTVPPSTWEWSGYFESRESIAVRMHGPETNFPRISSTYNIQPGQTVYFDRLYYRERMWWGRIRHGSTTQRRFLYVPMGYKVDYFRTDAANDVLWGKVTHIQNNS